MFGTNERGLHTQAQSAAAPWVYWYTLVIITLAEPPACRFVGLGAAQQRHDWMDGAVRAVDCNASGGEGLLVIRLLGFS